MIFIQDVNCFFIIFKPWYIDKRFHKRYNNTNNDIPIWIPQDRILFTLEKNVICMKCKGGFFMDLLSRPKKNRLLKKIKTPYLITTLIYVLYFFFIIFYSYKTYEIHFALVLIFPIITLGFIEGLKGGIVASGISSIMLFIQYYYIGLSRSNYQSIPCYLSFFITFSVIGILTGFLSNKLREQNRHLSFLYNNLRETQNKYEFRYNLVKITSSILDPIELSKKLVELLDISFGYSIITIFLADSKHEFLNIAAYQKGAQSLPIERIKFGQGITGMSAKYGKTIYVKDVTKEKNYIMGYKSTKSELAVPIKQNENVLGVLNLESDKYSAFTDVDIEYMELFADQVSISMANAQLMRSTWELSITDELTSLYNYRHFTNMLERKIDEARGYNRDLTILIVDLDDFKIINDTYRHPTGDKLLKKVGKVLLESVRISDVVARYGGEEFGIILPETDKAGGLLVANKIRGNIKGINIKAENGNNMFPLTVSVGIASYPHDASHWRKLVTEADKALYTAKGLGKDMVICR